jgi:hypothetical protein
LTPAGFLDQFNPMFSDGRNQLDAYTMPVIDFDNKSFQIMLINNSVNKLGDWLVGVLHTATIINPNPDLRRVINSTMIESVPQGHGEGLSVDEQNDFVISAVVRRPVYG